MPITKSITNSNQQLLDTYRAIMPSPEQFSVLTQIPLPTCFWVNTSKLSVDEFIKLMKEQGCVVSRLPWSDNAFRWDSEEPLGKRWEYLVGLVQIQETVSMLPVMLLDPQPGERVLDLCAAPGNKTAQIALQMQNTGTVIANDRNYQRMRALGQISKRLGLVNVTTTIYDGVNYPPLNNYFDRVLVDAPCSCEGTIRKRESKIVISKRSHSQRLAATQFALLRKALQVCRPGGTIVYSTCTFAPEENEGVIDRLLRLHGDEVDILPADLTNLKHSNGVTRWLDTEYHPDVKKAIRIWPQQNDTGGFFMALLRKRGDRDAEKIESTAERIPENVSPYLKEQCERFGISDDILKPYRFDFASTRGIYILNNDHALQKTTCPELKIDASGLFCIKTKIRYPKFSSSASMLLGRHATRNVIVLNEKQRDLYFKHEDINLSEEQASQCDETGYAVVRYGDINLGLGLYFTNPPRLRSIFPRYFN